MIKTARDLAGGMSDMDLIMTIHARNQGKTPLPSGEAAEPILKAEVNHGRWIVRCPFCAGAEAADPDYPRFYCLTCFNEPIKNRFLPVQWPVDRDGIEAELVRRSREGNQSWLPHETLSDLARETEAS